jgi:isopentenyl-diphosphate delta-isomerase
MANGREVVVRVDEDGRVLGDALKLAAHEAPGTLHLAFSVFLFRADGTTLVQRRALEKYHFAGYWANACCSHPAPGEDVLASAIDRVAEELGITVALVPAGHFVYRAVDPVSGRVEHELDHVFVGELGDAVLTPDPDEVAETRFVRPAEITETHLGAPVAPWVGEALALALAKLA